MFGVFFVTDIEITALNCLNHFEYVLMFFNIFKLLSYGLS